MTEPNTTDDHVITLARDAWQARTRHDALALLTAELLYVRTGDDGYRERAEAEIDPYSPLQQAFCGGWEHIARTLAHEVADLMEYDDFFLAVLNHSKAHARKEERRSETLGHVALDELEKTG